MMRGDIPRGSLGCFMIADVGERCHTVSLYKLALLHFRILSNTSDMNKEKEIEKSVQINRYL